MLTFPHKHFYASTFLALLIKAYWFSARDYVALICVIKRHVLSIVVACRGAWCSTRFQCESYRFLWHEK